jgi:uncharacterized protein
MDLSPTATELEMDPEVFSNLGVAVRLDRQGERIYVQIGVEGVARLQCDRTLVDYDQELTGTHSLLFVPSVDAEDLGVDGEDVRVLEQGETHIDITEAVRDTLMLAVPIRRIAPGADDLELPSSFGVDEDAIDPRWEALKKLRESGS